MIQPRQKPLLSLLKAGVLLHISGYLLVTNVTLHRNLFYGMIVLPIVIISITKFSSVRRFVQKEPIIWLLIAVISFFAGSASWGLDLGQALKNSIYTLSFIGAISAVRLNTPFEEYREYLLLLAFTTTVYLLLVVTAFFLAGQFGSSRLESILIFLGIEGYGYLAEIGYYRGGWTVGFPRLDVGGNNLANPINAALFYGFNILTLLMYLASGPVHRGKLILILTSLALLFLGILLTQSRGPLLALILAMFVGSFALKSLSRIALAVVFTISIIVISIAAATSEFVAYTLRINSLTDSVRVHIYETCLKDGLNNPVLGIGFHETSKIVHPIHGNFAHCHNIFLDTFRQTGAIGLLLMVALLVSVALRVKLGNRTNFFWLVILLYGLFFLQFDGRLPLTKPTPSWLVFWLPIAMLIFPPNESPEDGN
jgi:O-antigen ligase